MNSNRIAAKIDGLLKGLNTTVVELGRKTKLGEGSNDVEAIISEINTGLLNHHVEMTLEQQRKYERLQRVYDELMRGIYPQIR